MDDGRWTTATSSIVYRLSSKLVSNFHRRVVVLDFCAILLAPTHCRRHAPISITISARHACLFHRHWPPDQARRTPGAPDSERSSYGQGLFLTWVSGTAPRAGDGRSSSAWAVSHH